MIIYNTPQGSAEWLQARAGVITASMFKLTRKDNRLKSGPSKGDYKSDVKDYAFRVAIERISGAPLDDGFETWAMKRGHELEPEARRRHEATGLLVEEVGFVTTDDGVFGASADGFIGHDGGAEYKCFVSPEKLRDIILAGDISDITDQAQGGMWLTGRAWWDVVLYCPALEPVGKDLSVFRVQRDDDFIANLEADLLEFKALVDGFESQLRRKAA